MAMMCKRLSLKPDCGYCQHAVQYDRQLKQVTQPTSSSNPWTAGGVLEREQVRTADACLPTVAVSANCSEVSTSSQQVT